jgi:hypothetical protein
MSSENCSRRPACPRPACWSATPAGGPLPDVPLIILCSMATDAFKEAVSVGDTRHVTMHYRHPGAVVQPNGDLLGG